MNAKKLKVGEVLSRIMIERGLSTKQVSTMCGVPVSTLTHIKNGGGRSGSFLTW
ncbi:MAG TPA: helix-turn-helix transcriptional regulator [Pseudobdellovibrionaceae bacterium]|nr:helix-turn-helix transcriptional regulator [Pseudobdellovibrionaceae bacterium]